MATASDVAHFLLSELERQGGWLDEADAVPNIERLFGEEFVCPGVGGRSVLNPSVLQAFRELTAGSVVYNAEERTWRYEAGEDGSRIA